MAGAGILARCRIRLALSMVVLAGLVPGARAQSQDLLQIWELAFARDPLYGASQAARKADREVVPQARAQLLPSLSASTLGQYRDIRRARNFGESGSGSRAAWALTLTQPLIDIGRWDQLEQSEYLARSSDIALRSAYQDLVLRVAQAYFDVLAAQDTLRALLAQKEAVTTQLQAARQGFELGSTTIADTYEAQSRLDLLNAGEYQARNTLQVSKDRLAEIIAERPRELAELDPATRLPAPEPARLDDWADRARDANLAVTQAQLVAKITEKQIDIAKSGHYPTLDFYAQTGSASDLGIYPNSQGPRGLETTVGVQLSIPLYAGGGISSRVREQTSRLQAARYRVEAARRQAVQETEQYYSGVTSGLAQIRALEAAEKSSLASLQANQLGYEIGVRISMDVLDAQQQLFETQRALSRARYDTLMNSLRLKASSGILDQTDIVAVNALLAPPAAQALPAQSSRP